MTAPSGWLKRALALFLFSLVFLVEPLNASCGVNDLLFTGKEGMAFIAQLNPQRLPGRTGRESVTA